MYRLVCHQLLSFTRGDDAAVSCWSWCWRCCYWQPDV